MRNKWFGFMEPLLEEPGDTGAGSGELSINDTMDALAADDEPAVEDDILDEPKDKDDKETKEPKEKKEGDEPDEEEINLDEELDPEELDKIEEVPRKEILKKYPELFKDFPQLQRSYYREQEYAKLLPTIDDAKEAVEKAQNYDKFESVVLSGDISDIIGSIKTADAQAYNKMVDGYLPTLQKVDQNAYYHVIGNVIKSTIIGMFQEANASDNEDLKAAGVILNQFIFGKSNFDKPVAFGPHKPEAKDDETTKQQQEFYKERFDTALDTLTNRSNNLLKSTISKHIDPKQSMTSYVKNTAIEKALAETNKVIESDSRFKSILNRLWEKAAKSNFSKASLDDIERAFIQKAKTLLPEVIRKHRSEALKGLGKRVNEEREEPQRKGPVSVGRSAPANNRSKETTVPKGMRSIDYLMQD